MKTQKTKNVLLVSILPKSVKDEDALKDLQELKALVEAYGGVVCDLVVQRREVHDRGMYIGRGKLEEVGKLVTEKAIDIVVLNAIIKPGQIFEMKKHLHPIFPDIKVWDRVDLILHIFSAHAKTAEAKLQIELAAMRHMGPRIYGMGEVMSRQGGGIGTLGVGETNTELMKRHWRDQMKKVKDKLKKHTEDRQRQLVRRVKNNIQTISIVGYTNAGKTSLFNILTGKKDGVKNALFVTLDSSVSHIYLKGIQKEVLLTDTIGFIQNLPMSLIDAFQSTLLESMHADVLLIVIDASDTQFEKKIAVVEKILYGLQLEKKKRVYVFNKIDIASISLELISEQFAYFKPQFISVKNEEGIETLKKAIESALTDLESDESVVLSDDRDQKQRSNSG
jgi:GTPase